jgi:hypothetical protein
VVAQACESDLAAQRALQSPAQSAYPPFNVR